jgi:diguanylate cyclase
MVNQDPDLEGATEKAAGDLARLEDQVRAMRSVLVRLLQDVVIAESQLDSGRAHLLVQANEELVVAALQHQADANAAALDLEVISRAVGLDPLTQLPNRMLFVDRFTRAIAAAKRHDAPLALLFIDLNNFKQINDTLGHGVGDEVLKFAATCLVAAVRDVDTVSRHGGDEFLILLTEVSKSTDAIIVADKLLAALGAPHRFGEHVVRLSASIGVALYPQDGGAAETLIDRADTAMYQAKASGPGSCVVHAGQVWVKEDSAPALKSMQRPLTQYEQALAEHGLRYTLLQEANEQLVVSALNSQELQAAAQKAQQKQLEFLAMIAHELRNPLAPIRLATSMLGRVRTDEPLLPRAQAIIERQTVQMARLVDDLLDVTRAKTGRLAIELEEVDIVEVIDDAIDASRPAMDTRLQSFEVKAPSRPLKVRGDPVRLVQVVNNLLNNASKYTPDGGAITLTVAVADSCLLLTVQDNGIGISPGVLPDVFEPFVQDTHAIGFNGAGLGVGLTVVRQLVEAHGGTVVASSAGRGHGSRFVVTLPLLPQPAQREQG